MASPMASTVAGGKMGSRTCALRVEPADDALQLGELLHQLGRQIGLAQVRGLEDDAGTNRAACAANGFADQTAQLLHATGLVVVAAEVLLEGHRLQHRHAIAQRDLLIGLPEKARIVEAGAQHALVAVANEAVGIAVGVEHGEEMRQQLAVGIFQREVFLVIAHDGDKNFVGEREEFGIEAAQNG